MADSVLASGCSLTSCQIWIEIFIVCDSWHMHKDWKIERWEEQYVYTQIWVAHLRFGKRELPQCHQVAQVEFGRMWHQFWCRLSESLRWWCTRAFGSPACLGIVCCTDLARKAAVRLMFPKHSQVSFHCSLHILMPRKLKSPFLLFSALSLRFLDQVLCFLYCGAQKLSSGHFGRIQGKVHVRLV